jgi:hypothetical protein
MNDKATRPSRLRRPLWMAPTVLKDERPQPMWFNRPSVIRPSRPAPRSSASALQVPPWPVWRPWRGDAWHWAAAPPGQFPLLAVLVDHHQRTSRVGALHPDLLHFVNHHNHRPKAIHGQLLVLMKRCGVHRMDTTAHAEQPRDALAARWQAALTPGKRERSGPAFALVEEEKAQRPRGGASVNVDLAGGARDRKQVVPRPTQRKTRPHASGATNDGGSPGDVSTVVSGRQV